MKIHRLSLKNFRGFYGEHTIEFSVDPEKNITLIHAENGVGKTTLLNSILWCFYGVRPSGFLGEMENTHSIQEEEKIYFVSVLFEENNKKYQAKRVGGMFDNEPKLQISEIIDGDYRTHPAPDQLINSIIPQEIAPYFFFRGEGSKKFSIDSGIGIKTAIKDILGITIAQKALDQLNIVIKDYRKQLGALDKSKDLSKKLIEIDRFTGWINDDENKIEAANEKIRSCDARLKENNELIKESNHTELKYKQTEIDNLEKNLKGLRKREKALIERKKELIRKNAASAFSERIERANLDFARDGQGKGLIHSPYSDRLVGEITKKLVCICDRPFEKLSKEMTSIKALLANATDSVLEKRVQVAQSRQTAVNTQLQGAFDEFQKLSKEYSEVLTGIRKDSTDLEKAKKDLSKIIPKGDINPEEISRKMTVDEKTKSEATEARGRAKQRLDQHKQSLSRAQAEESQMKRESGDVEKYRGIIEFIKKIIDKLTSTIESAEKSAKPGIEKKINEFLKKFASKEFKVILDENFNITLYDSGKIIQQKSDGEERLLSLTFISSLIEFSKIRAGTSGSILSPGAVAPFILDAPFGDLDTDYGDSIAQYLPKVVDQVVFLLSTRHWSDEIEKVIRGRIGKEYNVVHEVTDEQGIKEEKYIEILGTKYQKTKYGMEIKTSRIIEVDS